MLPTRWRPPKTELEQLVRQKIEDWLAGEAPDAAQFVSKHPEVRWQKQLMLDLLYEEFCIRRERGERISVDRFCDPFPEHRSAFRQVLAVEEYFNRALAPPILGTGPAAS